MCVINIGSRNWKPPSSHVQRQFLCIPTHKSHRRQPEILIAGYIVGDRTSASWMGKLRCHVDGKEKRFLRCHKSAHGVQPKRVPLTERKRFLSANPFEIPTPMTFYSGFVSCTSSIKSVLQRNGTGENAAVIIILLSNGFSSRELLSLPQSDRSSSRSKAMNN